MYCTVLCMAKRGPPQSILSLQPFSPYYLSQCTPGNMIVCCTELLKAS